MLFLVSKIVLPSKLECVDIAVCHFRVHLLDKYFNLWLQKLLAATQKALAVNMARTLLRRRFYTEVF